MKREVGTVTVRHPCLLIADLEADTHSKAVATGRNGEEVLLAFRAPDGSTTWAVTVDDEVACVVFSDEVTGVGA